MSKGKLGLIGLAVAIAILAFVIASPSSDNGSSKKTATARAPVTHIIVTGGKPVGGIRKIKAKKGDRVAFDVKSDVSDEIHVHGYDFMKDVKAGKRIAFAFPARIAGSFEIELERAKQQIASLQVEP